jgi:hypothetical protein
MAAQTLQYRKLFCVLLIPVLSACARKDFSQSSPYPFIGTWDCEVSEFTLTESHYRVGTDKVLRIKEVERSGNDFRFTLEDGYAFSLFGVSATSMTWHSLETGDTFACTRVL